MMRTREWAWDVSAAVCMIVLGVAMFMLAWPPATAMRPAYAQAYRDGRLIGATQPCGAPPPGDTLMGTPGMADCFVPGDATRPTVVQAANVRADTSGNWSVTWGRAFNSAVPMVLPLPINTAQLPIQCNVTARSASSATGRCWQSTTTTLPGTLTSLAGLVVSPFGTAAANAEVMVIGREPTQ